jgi:replicative DNA helicase
MSRRFDERGLPANLDAERFVLGAILSVEGAFSRVSATLTLDDFSLEKNRRIFARMADLHARGAHIDHGTVAHELIDHGQLESVDGMSYLASLDDGLPQVFDADDYVRTVKRKSVMRRAVIECNRTAHALTIEGGNSVEEIERAQRILRELSAESTAERRLRTPWDIMTERVGGVEAFLQPHRNEPGIPFPWSPVNHVVPGMKPSQFFVIAARTSGGKTAAALQIAAHAATAGRTPVIFSIEMSAESLLHRILCAWARVDTRRFFSGNVTDLERRILSDAAGKLAALPLRIDDASCTTLPAIEAALLRLAAQCPVDLVIVDYLQIMECVGRHENRAQEVSKLSRGLKLLAREHRVPVIALAQFNRAPGKEGRRPQLHDLKESGSIEQDADVVIFLHSEDNPAQDADLIDVEFIVAKQRNGPIGKLDMHFNRRQVRFFTDADEA